MNMQQALKTVTEGQDLSQEDMRSVMKIIMTGEATQAQIGGFLVGLRMKGETIDEITGAVETMRTLATKVPTTGAHVIDTCGTGGDSSGIFNVSTASAFIVAAAGGQVAKHGNRSITSKSGSSDLLAAAGLNLALNPDQVAQCITQTGVGFMFAPAHHSAMKHAIGPRQEMAVRTIFNILGPLTNPAGSPHQLLGVFGQQWQRPMAEVLKRLGSQHVMVVHADDGLDEISIAATTHVVELKNNQLHEYTINPNDYGLAYDSLDSLVVQSAQQSLAMIHSALNNTPGAALDMLLLNAGAAIYVADLADTIAAGIQKARTAVASGEALARMQQLMQLSQSFTDS